MMAAWCPTVSSLALLVLLSTVRAGPFTPRTNVTRSALRPPPQPGGLTVEPGGRARSSQHYEHNVEGGEKQVVFTHRINLPPSTGCGCPPGTEPPAPASEVQALRVRLEMLEELVRGLKEQCSVGCCPANAQAGTGQTDIRSLCSLHGVFDLSRCACTCEPGWGGATCSDPTDAPAAGVSPSSPPSGSCPDDCNDQGRCVGGRCVCFPGYAGPSCGWPSCPSDCRGRGRCVQGVCVCRPGYSGDDCGQRSCPRGCGQHGRCEDGRCVCDPGYAGDDCRLRSCPRGCSQRGLCVNGRCVCQPGYAGDDCSVKSCPRGCSQQGRCENGRCVCHPGYTGEDCGTRGCPWDCGDGGRCVDGRCVCWPGYAGEDCSARTCPQDCHGRGRCEDGECICDTGYSGDDCSVRSCPGDCSQRGHCEDGRCVCWPGYTGPDCGVRACPQGCRGRGRCENGVCVCQAGYSGEDCGVRSCPGDCSGRGRCDSGRCVCWPGYTGRDCSLRACPGDCRGRGRCVDGRCVCNPGFAGEDCGSRRCPGDCRGRGRCEDGVCVCDAGYQGEDCGARSCPAGCRGRGQCVDGRCVCDEGFEGQDCGVQRCPRDCHQRGVCQDGVCACWEGYAGEDCGIRTCPSNCHRRGRCENGRCVCDPGYTGPACATRTCPSDCRGRGRCVQGVCVCHAGYGGDDCGQDAPPSSACPGGCGPRALCRNGQCVCVEGFTGPDCAIQTCPGDCLGRGECREGSCVCKDGYAGEDCGEEIPAIKNMRMQLVEETTVRTEWTREPGTVDAYEIQFIPTTEGVSPPFTVRVPSSASAYDQRGLAPGQEYKVIIRALRGTNWGPPTSKTITTMIDGPQDLRVVAVTPTTLDLSWLRPQAEVDRFVVSYVSAGNQRVRLETPPDADRMLLTGLMPGVEYVVTVTAERGAAVSYPSSIRANTAPGHYNYPEVRPPVLGPVPRPPRPSRRPQEEGEASRPLPPPPRSEVLLRELGRFRGTVQDLERHLRAQRYPLPANQTYTSLAHHIYEYLQRRLPAGSPAPPPRRPATTASPDSSTRKRDSNQGIYGRSPEGIDRVTATRHPKPEVLGSLADGSLLVSLDGLRGHFEQVVVRWWPQPPTEGPGGQLTVPGTTRTVRLPDLRPGITYHVEVHGVRAGQTSKSYAFITTTGFSPPDVSKTTDEPPPSGPPTTQGVRAPDLQHRPQELGELKVLDRDKTDHLRVVWTAQPDTFAHFQLHTKVQGQPEVHKELLPGDVREALVPKPPPGTSYELTLRGILPNGEATAPLTYYGITDWSETKPEKPQNPPRFGELTVTDVTSDSMILHWTVPEGEFDSFLIQYKDRNGPQMVRLEGPEREAHITNLELGRKYKFILYGLVGKKKQGSLVAEVKIVPQTDSSPMPPPRLGQLWVTDPTPDSLRLSWTVLEGQFDSFLVQYKDKDGRPQLIPVEGPERSFLVSPLHPDHKYRFSLFGIANKKRHGPLTADGTTGDPQGIVEETIRPTKTSVKPVLGELTVTGSSPDSLSLSWTVPHGRFDSFTVQYKDSYGRPQLVRVGGEEREVTVQGLEPGRKYKMNLYGLHEGQRVGPVSTMGVTDSEEEPPKKMESTPSPTEASMEPPEEPVLGELTVTGSSPDSLSLSWTVPQGRFDSFTIQYKDSYGRPQLVRVGGEEREVTVQDLEPGRKYKMNLYGLHEGQRVGPVSTVGMTDSEEEPPTEMESTPSPTEAITEPPEEPVLGDLTVTGSSPDSLSLSWTVPQGRFDSFTVQYKDSYGRPQLVRVGGEEREVTVQGLEPGRKYKMNLYGLHEGRRVGPVSTVGVTDSEEEPPTEMENTSSPTETIMEPPIEPVLGELTVTASSPDSLSLSWMVPQGRFDTFTVQYQDSYGRPQLVRVGGEEREVTVQGLEPGRKYKMNLYGLHEGRRVGPVSTVGVTDSEKEPPREMESTPSPTEAIVEPPEEPVLGELTVTGSSSDSLSLSWTVPQGHFDSFTVQYKDSYGRPQLVRVGGEEREVTVQGLEPGRKYKMNLYGLHEGRRVGPVFTVGMTEEIPPATESPRKPQLGELIVTDVTPNSVDLAWTVAEGQFDSFVVQYKDKDGLSQMIQVAQDQLEVTIPGLEPAHTYTMNLYGLTEGQHVGPLAVVAITAPLPPTVATEILQKPLLGELKVISVTPDSVGLSWTVPQGEFDSFVVQYKDRDGQVQMVPVAADQREVIVPGLEPNRKYKFMLFGIEDGKRRSPVSVEAKTEPRSDTVINRPQKPLLGEELKVTSVTSDTVGLSWTVPEGQFDSFVVQYKGKDGQPQVVSVEGHLREVSVSGLDPARRYKLLLYGLYKGKRVGPLSATVTTNSEEEPPTEMESTPSPTEAIMEPPEEPILGELTVTGSSPDSLSLSWMVPQGRFDSFTIQYQDSYGRPQLVRVGGEEREVTMQGLEPGRKYKMNLYGLHEGRRVGPMSIVGITDSEKEPPREMESTPSPTEANTEPPEEPVLGELKVTGSSPDSLSLSWTVPQGHFDSFTVQYKDSYGRPQLVRVGGEEREVTVQGLEPGRKYKMNLYGLHKGRHVGPIFIVGMTDSEEESPTEMESTPTPTEAITEPPKEPVLGELTVTGSSPDSLSLSWTVPQGRFDSFTVQYKDSYGRPQLVRIGGEEREVTVPGLEPGRKYKMNLYGLHEGRRVGPISIIGMTVLQEEPDSMKPRLGELTVTDTTPESLSLSWTVPEGHFDHFLVQYKNGDGQPKVVRVPGYQDRVTISGLEPDHKYKMNLYGFHGDQREGPISTIASTAKEEEMTPVTSAPTMTSQQSIKPRLGELTVTGATPGSLSLSWTVPEGHFDHFLVQYKNGDGHPKALRVPGHQSRVTISGLEPDHKYKMNLFGFHSGQRVGPISAIGVTVSEEEPPTEMESTPSPTEAITEPPEEPVLGELTVTGSSPDSLSLSWTVPQGRFDSFTVQYKDSYGRPQLVRVGGEDREVTVQGLEPGRKYKMNLYGLHEGRRVGPIFIVGVTDSEEEHSTEMESTPSPTEASMKPPEKPVLGELMVTGSSPDSLSLSWTVPQGRFDSFTVQYKDSYGRPQLVRVGGEEREVTVPGLEPGRKYKMNLYGLHEGRRVGPVFTVGVTDSEEEPPTEMESTPSPTEAITKPPIEPVLGELTVTGSSPDSLSLSWTVPQGHFDSFTVQYKDSYGQPQLVRVGGEEREVTVQGLEPGRKYKMNLYGLHEGRRVGPIFIVGVTDSEEEPPTEMESIPSPTEPIMEPPIEPVLGELTVTGSSPDSLSLSWTVPQGRFDSFTVQYKDSYGRPQLVRVGGEEREVTVQGLEPGRKYKMNLYGQHEGQRVGPVSTVGVTESQEAPIPTEISIKKPVLGELTVTGSSPDSLSLSWTVPQGRFDSFIVQYKDIYGQPQLVRVGGEEREVTVPGLEPGRKYKMNLYGLHEGRRVGPVFTVGVTDSEEEPPTEIESKPSPTEASTETPEEPVLGELKVTGSSPDSLSLSWMVPQGRFDSFTVQYKDSYGRPQLVRVGGEEREVTVQGLEPGRKYKMNLYGLHEGQRVGPVSTMGVTDSEEEPPTEMESTPSPTEAIIEPREEPVLGELTVTGSSPDSLSLSWTVPQGRFDSFTVQYKDIYGQPQVVHVGGEEHEVTVQGLEPGRKYKMNLYGLHEGRRMGPVSTVGVTDSKEKPPTEMESTPSPTEAIMETLVEPVLGELTVRGSSPDSLSLSWTVSQGHFDTFTVQYKDIYGRPQLVRVGGEEREVTVQGLEPGRKYKMNLYGLHNGRRVGPVSIVGVTDSEEEPPTEMESTRRPKEAIMEPLLGELTVTGSSPASLSLSWTVPQGRFDAFTIQYKDKEGWPQMVDVDGEEREVIVQGLEPGQKYKMHLYGLHDGRRVGPVSTVGVTAKDEEMAPVATAPSMITQPSTKPHLGELTVTDATSESLSLSWTVPEGHFDHFLVQYKNGDGQPKALRVPGHQHRVTISGLEPDHKYKMNLFGFHSGQRVGPVSAIGVTVSEEEPPTEMESTPSPTKASTEAPEEPVLGDLTVTGSSPDSLSLFWTVPQGRFDSFTVQYKDIYGQPQLVRVGGEEREVTVQGLEPGRKYKMNLYGLHDRRRVGPVSTVGVTAPLPTQPLMEPRLGELAVVAVTSDTVHLSWPMAQGPFDSFLVQYKGAQGQPQAVSVYGDLREVIISDLDPARKYKFLLFGLQDEKKHGPVSAEAKTLPDRKPSPVLGELTVTSVTSDSIGLSWTVHQGQFDSFMVQYKDRDGQVQMVPVAADQREVIVPDLEPNKKYKFMLYGQAGRKRLGPISAEGTTAALEKKPPPSLGELTVTGETPDSLRLSWTVAQGPFDSFLIQFNDADGRPRTVPAAADQREITIEDLEPHRTYTFLLYGIIGGQHLGPISVLGVTAPKEDKPEAPEPLEEPQLGELTVSEVAPHSLRLSWTVAQGTFDSFMVQYPGANGKPQTLLVGGNQNKVLVSNLEPSTSYKFLLYGLRNGKRLGPISAEGTTGPAPPGQTSGEPGPRLSQLSVTDVTTSSLRLNWEAPPGAFDSFLLRYGIPSSSPLEPYPRPLMLRELKVKGDLRTAVLRDLSPSTLYSLTLYGLRGPHKADSVQGTARTLSPVLESPRDLQFSEVKEHSAIVHWTPPLSQVDGFKVSYQLSGGGEPQSVQVDRKALNQLLEGLASGSTYEVTVVSIRGFEESEPLTGIFTTVSDGPTNIQVLNLTKETAVLLWDPPNLPVDKYDLEVTAEKVPPISGSAPGTAVEYTLDKLEPYTNYTATMWGTRGSNLTSSASVNFTTGLEAARDLEAKEVTPRTALLTWAEPQDPPTGYLLSFSSPGGETQEILLPGSIISYQLQGLFPSTLYSAWLRAMWGESFTPPVSTSFTTGGLRVPFPRDCGEEMQNGASTSRPTTIFLNGNRERPLNVYCDMETDGGGWLVFQRRMDGKTDFWRDWEEYAHGFGNISREFWLGNEALHSLTKAGDYSLRVDLRAGDEAVFAEYDSFRVDSAAQNYRLHVEGYHGTAGDSMSYHSGSVFSARNRDPNNSLISCAVSYRGAWWYRNCHYANLNGLYGSTVDHQGVSWYYWKGFEFSVPFTEMKLRPRNYQPPVQGG